MDTQNYMKTNSTNFSQKHKYKSFSCRTTSRCWSPGRRLRRPGWRRRRRGGGGSRRGRACTAEGGGRRRGGGGGGGRGGEGSGGSVRTAPPPAGRAPGTSWLGKTLEATKWRMETFQTSTSFTTTYPATRVGDIYKGAKSKTNICAPLV